MAKKSGLGKGLNALFADALEDDVEEVKIEDKIEGEGVRTLKITEVEPNRNQPIW